MQSTKSPNPEAPVKFCRLAGRSACVHAKMIQMLCIQRNNLYQFMAFHTNYRNILEAMENHCNLSYSILTVPSLKGTQPPASDQYLPPQITSRSGGTYGEAVRSILGSLGWVSRYVELFLEKSRLFFGIKTKRGMNQDAPRCSKMLQDAPSIFVSLKMWYSMV